MCLGAAGCGASDPPPTSPVRPGTADLPREVNLIAKDYSFLPQVLDLVPGEIILLHVINGGLDVHEAVLGDESVQTAWEVAEAAAEGGPPGPTPQVSVPPGGASLHVVVRSGERMDVRWEVPLDTGRAGPSGGGWLVGCHIPGHLARGMVIPVRWVARP